MDDANHLGSHLARLRKEKGLDSIWRRVDGRLDGTEYPPTCAVDLAIFVKKGMKTDILSILKRRNIDVMEGNVEKGGFSWAIDIGAGQMLHISTPSNKLSIRYSAPEILKPLKLLTTEDDPVRIEIIPKAKTEGVTKEHAQALVASLLKRDPPLLFVDCQPKNVGLITVDGKEIPVVIGMGAVIGMDDGSLRGRYYHSDFSNADIFQYWNRRVFDRQMNFEGNIAFFKNDHTHEHPWVTERGGKDVWLKGQGLEEGKVKGLTSPEEVAALRQREGLSPLAKELVDCIAEHSLRPPDVREVAADLIAEKWGNEPDFERNFRAAVEESRQKNASPANAPHLAT